MQAKTDACGSDPRSTNRQTKGKQEAAAAEKKAGHNLAPTGRPVRPPARPADEDEDEGEDGAPWRSRGERGAFCFSFVLPHAVGPGAELLADAREAGIKILDEARLDDFVRQRQLQRPRHRRSARQERLTGRGRSRATRPALGRQARRKPLSLEPSAHELPGPAYRPARQAPSQPTAAHSLLTVLEAVAAAGPAPFPNRRAQSQRPAGRNQSAWLGRTCAAAPWRAKWPEKRKAEHAAQRAQPSATSHSGSPGGNTCRACAGS